MFMIAVGAALLVLAAVTQAGAIWLQQRYPAQGRMIDVAGGQIHLLELGPAGAPRLPIVFVHGASSNLGTMRVPLGERLARSHRVILIDRPGHGWSSSDDLENSSPATQARMIEGALAQIGVDRAVVVVHSMAGALGARLALDFPQRVAGLVVLAPVAYPWPGGVGAYNKIVTTPVIEPLPAHTITLPLGWFLVEPGTRGVFLPQTMPDGYVAATAIPLLLRRREFLANARDLVTLKAAVAAQAPRYGEIKAPTVVIAGDADKTVSADIHARPFVAAVPGARLIVLPNVGHMVQNAAPDLVIDEIEAMVAAADTKAKAALR